MLTLLGSNSWYSRFHDTRTKGVVNTLHIPSYPEKMTTLSTQIPTGHSSLPLCLLGTLGWRQTIIPVYQSLVPGVSWPSQAHSVHSSLIPRFPSSEQNPNTLVRFLGRVVSPSDVARGVPSPPPQISTWPRTQQPSHIPLQHSIVTRILPIDDNLFFSAIRIHYS